jgi:hypothetical protein
VQNTRQKEEAIIGTLGYFPTNSSFVQKVAKQEASPLLAFDV